MNDLLALQRAFAAALAGEAALAPALAQADESPPAPSGLGLAGDAAQQKRRLSIYRANTAAAGAKALKAAYPVIAQVVGEDFFQALARAYQRAVPSTSGNLNDFGASFAGFLAEFEPTQSMPYLPDLARLEWAVHRAEGASDAPPWDPSTLAAVPPERHGAIRFDWAAGTAVIESAYPLARLWAIHQPGHDDFSVDWQVAEAVLVAREGFAVTVQALPADEVAFIACSLSGEPLEAAADAALAVDAAFDLGALLARAFAAGWIGGHRQNSNDEE